MPVVDVATIQSGFTTVGPDTFVEFDGGIDIGTDRTIDIHTDNIKRRRGIIPAFVVVGPDSHVVLTFIHRNINARRNGALVYVDNGDIHAIVRTIGIIREITWDLNGKHSFVIQNSLSALDGFSVFTGRAIPVTRRVTVHRKAIPIIPPLTLHWLEEEFGTVYLVCHLCARKRRSVIVFCFDGDLDLLTCERRLGRSTCFDFKIWSAIFAHVDKGIKGRCFLL